MDASPPRTSSDAAASRGLRQPPPATSWGPPPPRRRPRGEKSQSSEAHQLPEGRPQNTGRPALRSPGCTPYKPEATASGRVGARFSPGDGRFTWPGSGRQKGGDARGRGVQGAGCGRGQGVAVQPRGLSGANMAGGGGVSRRGRGSGADGAAHHCCGRWVLVLGFSLRQGSGS